MTCRAAWCGQCYENIRRRANHKGHRGYRAPREPYTPPIWEGAMKKPTKEEAKMTPARGELLRGLDSLWDALTADTYDDGTKRKRCSLLIVMDGGHAKLCLVDKHEGRTAWVAMPSMDEAFLAMDEQLADGSIAWRAQQENFGKRTR
jgi:hypothetical protein